MANKIMMMMKRGKGPKAPSSKTATTSTPAPAAPTTTVLTTVSSVASSSSSKETDAFDPFAVNDGFGSSAHRLRPDKTKQEQMKEKDNEQPHPYHPRNGGVLRPSNHMEDASSTMSFSSLSWNNNNNNNNARSSPRGRSLAKKRTAARSPSSAGGSVGSNSNFFGGASSSGGSSNFFGDSFFDESQSTFDVSFDSNAFQFFPATTNSDPFETPTPFRDNGFVSPTSSKLRHSQKFSPFAPVARRSSPKRDKYSVRESPRGAFRPRRRGSLESASPFNGLPSDDGSRPNSALDQNRNFHAFQPPSAHPQNDEWQHFGAQSTFDTTATATESPASPPIARSEKSPRSRRSRSLDSRSEDALSQSQESRRANDQSLPPSRRDHRRQRKEQPNRVTSSPSSAFIPIDSSTEEMNIPDSESSKTEDTGGILRQFHRRQRGEVTTKDSIDDDDEEEARYIVFEAADVVPPPVPKSAVTRSSPPPAEQGNSVSQRQADLRSSAQGSPSTLGNNSVAADSTAKSQRRSQRREQRHKTKDTVGQRIRDEERQQRKMDREIPIKLEPMQEEKVGSRDSPLGGAEIGRKELENELDQHVLAASPVSSSLSPTEKQQQQQQTEGEQSSSTATPNNDNVVKLRLVEEMSCILGAASTSQHASTSSKKPPSVYIRGTLLLLGVPMSLSPSSTKSSSSASLDAKTVSSLQLLLTDARKHVDEFRTCSTMSQAQPPQSQGQGCPELNERPQLVKVEVKELPSSETRQIIRQSMKGKPQMATDSTTRRILHVDVTSTDRPLLQNGINTSAPANKAHEREEYDDDDFDDYYHESVAPESDEEEEMESGEEDVDRAELSRQSLQLQRPIAKYVCQQRLLCPVPLLVHTRVRIAGKFCRVGLKIRSNPANKSSLHDMAVMMGVPLDVNGSTMKMSRRGGLWDEMKRLVTWYVPNLDPAKTIEIQVQFEFSNAAVAASAAPESTAATTISTLVESVSDEQHPQPHPTHNKENTTEDTTGRTSQNIGIGPTKTISSMPPTEESNTVTTSSEGLTTPTDRQLPSSFYYDKSSGPPHFPVMVRSDCQGEQLSDLSVQMISETGEGSNKSRTSTVLQLELARSYRIFLGRV